MRFELIKPGWKPDILPLYNGRGEPLMGIEPTISNIPSWCLYSVWLQRQWLRIAGVAPACVGYGPTEMTTPPNRINKPTKFARSI